MSLSPQGLTEDPEPLFITLLPDSPQKSFDEGCDNQNVSVSFPFLIFFKSINKTR